MAKAHEYIHQGMADSSAQTRSAMSFARTEDDSLFWPLFANSPSGLIIVSGNGCIRSVNSRLLEMFGYCEDDVVGQTIEMLMPVRARAVHVASRTEYVRHPKARAMGAGRDLTGLRSDGIEFPIEVLVNPVDYHGEQVIMAMVIDITERRRTEKQLREAKARVEEFSYVASHDLRSPIRGIANLIEFLREDLGEGATPEILRHVDRMAMRVEAAEKLINDLLAYARAGKGEASLDTISLKQLVPWIVELEGFPESYRIDIDVPEGTFWGSETELAMVIRNLVGNAVKHHDRESGTITVRAWFENSSCIIEVADDGPGIPASAQDRVWRLFQRLNPKNVEGSGLGLALVRRTVEGNGGSISLHSTDGERGATFRVEWPRFPRADHDD